MESFIELYGSTEKQRWWTWVKPLLHSPLVYGLGIVGAQLRFQMPF